MPITSENLLKAIKLMREKSQKRNFQQSIDLFINLKDFDPKKPESRINVTILLPHGTGKPRKIGFFAEGELARQARDAGADLVLGRKDIESLQRERKQAKKIVEEQDFFLSQADLMVMVGKVLGPVLGPRGKMPRPIPPTEDPKPIIERLRKTIMVKTKDQPTLQAQIGNESMNDEQLAANALAVLESIESKLEKGLKQLGSIRIKTTMGEPVKVEV